MADADAERRLAALEKQLAATVEHVRALEFGHAALAFSLLRLIGPEWNDDTLTGHLVKLANDADALADLLGIEGGYV